MKTISPILPRIQELKDLLSYCPDTGKIHWKIKRAGWSAGRSFAGKIAGSPYASGHRVIRVNKVRYMEHRLAWVLFHNEEAPPLIDHINGDPSDNRIVNLRGATRAQNAMNSKLYRNSTSGTKGVCWSKLARKWIASIYTDGKTVHLGSFDDKALAAAAYQTAAKSLHGDFARV